MNNTDNWEKDFDENLLDLFDERGSIGVVKDFIRSRLIKEKEKTIKKYKDFVEDEVIGIFGGNNPEEKKRMRTRLGQYQG